MAMLIVGAALTGAAAAALLLVKDSVAARLAAGKHLHPLLLLYFGRDFLSLVVWLVTFLVVVRRWQYS